MNKWYTRIVRVKDGKQGTGVYCTQCKKKIAFPGDLKTCPHCKLKIITIKGVVPYQYYPGSEF
jgi:hypothetical protein